MFTTDSQTENFLTHKGVEWSYSNRIMIKDLHQAWARANAGRSKVQLDDAIEEYALRMDGGSAAPAPILRKVDREYHVLDGVQRISAAVLRGTTQMSAYVVVTDSNLIATLIRITANAHLSGRTEPPEWTQRHAVQSLVIEGGMSVEEVAKLCGWTNKAVQKEKDYLDWSHAIAHIGGPDVLPKGIVAHVRNHAKMEDFTKASAPIGEFLTDLKRGRFSNGDSETYISDFFNVSRKNPKRLHAIYAKQLESFHSDPEVATRLHGRTKARMTPEINLRRQLKCALTVTNDLIRDGTHITYMEEFYTLWRKVEKNLKTIQRSRRKT